MVSIIHEAGCGESIPKGFVFAGGVTKTDHFFETLRKLSPEYREVSLRRDIYEDVPQKDLLSEYITEIALAAQASEPGVSYELRPLESLLQEQPEVRSSEPTEPVEEPKEAEEESYTYTTISEAQRVPLDDDEDDYFDYSEEEEDEEEEDTKRETKRERKEKKSWSLNSFINSINGLFGANDGGDDF